jgi:tagatose 1,6-diphosphate aldolase
MLSAGATKCAFTRILTYAYRAGASGFLAGRAIWWDEAQAFPDMDAARRALRSTSASYMESINQLTDELAPSFDEHRAYPTEGLGLASHDASFRSGYRSIIK